MLTSAPFHVKVILRRNWWQHNLVREQMGHTVTESWEVSRPIDNASDMVIVSWDCYRMTGNSAALGPFPVTVKQAHNINDTGHMIRCIVIELSLWALFDIFALPVASFCCIWYIYDLNPATNHGVSKTKCCCCKWVCDRGIDIWVVMGWLLNSKIVQIHCFLSQDFRQVLPIDYALHFCDDNPEGK